MAQDFKSARLGRPAPQLAKTYLMAVDFGTTYSGLAWVLLLKGPPPSTAHLLNRINLIKQWPAGGTSEKTPTTILYDSSKVLWGSEVPENEPKHEWFKLALEPTKRGENSQLAEEYPPLVPPSEVGVAPERLVVDYLKALRMHAESKLEETLLKKAPYNRHTKIRYVLTIPAMWSEKAKDLTRKCASDAGMGNPKSIKVITEPEAAAIYELMRRVETQEFSIDDTFVLCDAGGGTVDLISYTVKELQPPRVEEATSGSGGSCGSTFINRVFAKWLKSHLGDSPAWDDDVLFAAVDEFEQKVKKNFDPKKGHRDYMIRLPYFKDLPEKNIQKGKLGISTSQMKSFFEPVIIEVISLVRDQISRTQGRAKSVILVGGFGQSIYLKDRLQEAVQDGVRVVRGLNPVSAVVTGAAIYGVQESTPQIHVNSIESRKSRHHYGVEALVDYNSTIHESDKKFKDDFTGNLQVRAMNWIIHKEEPLQSSEPRKFSLYLKVNASYKTPEEIETMVYVSPSDKAPLYKDDDSVKELVKLTADLRSFDKDEFHTEHGIDGKLYYKLDFEIEMKCFAVFSEYALIYNGKRHDVVKKKHL